MPWSRAEPVACGVGIELGPQSSGRRRRVVGAVEQQRDAAPVELLQAPGPAGRRKACTDGGAIDGPATRGQGLAHPHGHRTIGGLDRAREPAGAPAAVDQQITSSVLG
jgi:hypothetical protein